MIQERVRAGLARAKSEGKKLTSDTRRHGKGYLVFAILLLGPALAPPRRGSSISVQLGDVGAALFGDLK
jgi:hypothetical protein